MTTTEPHPFKELPTAAAGPVLVVDIDRGLLVGMSPAASGRAGEGAGQTLPVALDAAMPLLADLRGLRDRGGLRTGAAAWASQLETVIWLPGGVWRGELEAAPADGAAGTVAVRPATPAGSAAWPRAGPRGAVRADPEAMRQAAGNTEDRPQPLPAAPPGLRHLAHELRTPLAGILALADAMHGGHLGPIESPRHRDYLVRMRETARHALAVIEAMLERPAGSPRRAPVPALDLGRLLGELADGMAALAARSGARVLVAPAVAGPVLASADPTAVRQMLLNLIANSLAHGGIGVTVTLGLGSAGDQGTWVEVADNGPGFPPAMLERIAGSSGAERDDGGRPGLGLMLTRALAEAAGGRLELASGPAGARARLLLPAYQPAGGDQDALSSRG